VAGYAWGRIHRLPTRLTSEQIDALPSPQAGDLAYDLTFRCLRVFSGEKWVCSDRKANDPTPDVLAWRAGGTISDYGKSVAVDGSGNVYVTGYYAGTASFGATTLTSAGEPDVFVSKYSTGGVLQWVRQAGGTGYDVGHSVSVDGSGNVYITGYFNNTATFGGTTLSSAGSNDVFLAKYDASGNLQWAQWGGGTSTDIGHSVAVDGSGNVYVTGLFYNTAMFGSTMLTSAGGYDVFVAKYNSGGIPQWARRVGGADNDVGYGVAVDGSGNVYVTGQIAGTVPFGGTTLTSAGYYDIFIARYDGSGNEQWAQRAGGTNFDYGYGVAADVSGNVYVTGYIQGTSSFGATTLTSAGIADIFVARYKE
jgi:hypothetical protein